MRKITILTTLVCLACSAFAQNADEEVLRKVTQAEIDAIVSRNPDAFKATWQQDANAVFANISPYGSVVHRSWDSVYTPLQKQWTANPKPDLQQIQVENYKVRSDGSMAWVDYDAIVTPVTTQTDIFPYSDKVHLHNYDLYVKEGDQWKLASQLITQPQNDTSNSNHLAEVELNSTGYRLLSAKKINEAIEVFKLNVKLNPGSWNVYDSLGEAYAAAGNKKAAIENYEKSMKLNPKSETAPPALAKLKGK